MKKPLTLAVAVIFGFLLVALAYKLPGIDLGLESSAHITVKDTVKTVTGLAIDCFAVSDASYSYTGVPFRFVESLNFDRGFCGTMSGERIRFNPTILLVNWLLVTASAILVILLFNRTRKKPESSNVRLPTKLSANTATYLLILVGGVGGIAISLGVAVLLPEIRYSITNYGAPDSRTIPWVIGLFFFCGLVIVVGHYLYRTVSEAIPDRNRNILLLLLAPLILANTLNLLINISGNSSGIDVFSSWIIGSFVTIVIYACWLVVAIVYAIKVSRLE